MESSQSPTTVLLIDDDPAVMDVILRMLEVGGYSIRSAKNGRQGLASHEEDPVDLIITDITMPGIDGFEVIRELKKVSPETRIIAISGDPEVDLAAAEPFGAHIALRKPVTYDELMLAITLVTTEGCNEAAHSPGDPE